MNILPLMYLNILAHVQNYLNTHSLIYEQLSLSIHTENHYNNTNTDDGKLLDFDK